MKDLIIKKADKTIVSAADLYNLRRASFEQWAEHGLNASYGNIPIEQFRNNLGSFTVFVALDKETGELLGMHTIRLNKKKGGVKGSNLAVLPAAKKTGIASRMLQEETEWLKKEEYRYIIETTAIPATWSVRWHLKNGYRIIGYSHGEGKNYASYVFRKQLYIDLRHHPSDLLWTSLLAPLTARLRFMASYIATRLCKHSDGSLNALGRLAKKMLRK